MYQIMKKNKILTIIIIITIITIIGSIIMISLLDNKTKDEINNKAITIIQNKEIQKNIINNKNLIQTLYLNLSLIVICWLLGISIIGSPIILCIYILKTLLLAWNIFFILPHIKLNNILFILFYLIPQLITLLILFITTFFSISYSILLIKILFFKKNYPIQTITKNYIKIMIIILLINILQSIIEVYIFPKIFSLI